MRQKQRKTKHTFLTIKSQYHRTRPGDMFRGGQHRWAKTWVPGMVPVPLLPGDCLLALWLCGRTGVSGPWGPPAAPWFWDAPVSGRCRGSRSSKGLRAKPTLPPPNPHPHLPSLELRAAVRWLFNNPARTTSSLRTLCFCSCGFLF